MNIQDQATLYANEVSLGDQRIFTVVRKAFLDGFNSLANSTQNPTFNPATEEVTDVEPLT